MEETIKEYGKILNEKIKLSVINNTFFQTQLNLKKGSFYNKLKNNNFTYEEVLIITKILDAEEKHIKKE